MTIETMRLLRVPQGLLLLLLGCHCDKVVAVALRSDAWPTCIQGTCQTAAAAPLILKSRRPALATRSPLFSSRRSDDFDGGERQRQSPQPRPFAIEAPPTTQQATDVPTQTVAEIIGVPSLPAKPKIVVLGATGGVGRHVVRQLMSTNVDMTVVAFCRNYDKALETLYQGAGDTDDDDQGGASGRSLVQRKSKRGPTLELVVGDLVDRSKVFNYKDEEDEIEVEFNSTTLASVRRFYGDSAADEVYKASSKKNDGETTDAHEALKMAIEDCTAIISCVGTVRPTNPWTDYVMNPLRIFRRASKWCSDPRHPYYVNYQSTREALALAEEEQARRDIEIEKFEQAEEEMAKEAAKMGRSYVPANGRSHKKKGPVERIKFVRISDLAVSIRPWRVVSLFTNIGRSLVFRDQEKCEIILENSKLIDTVTFAPGISSISLEMQTRQTFKWMHPVSSPTRHTYARKMSHPLQLQQLSLERMDLQRPRRKIDTTRKMLGVRMSRSVDGRMHMRAEGVLLEKTRPPVTLGLFGGVGKTLRARGERAMDCRTPSPVWIECCDSRTRWKPKGRSRTVFEMGIACSESSPR